MRRKAELGGRNQTHVAPAEPENIDHKSKHGETPKANSDVLNAQRVVRSVSEAPFVHFYLACGHLITISKSELEGAWPGEIECWACAMGK